ncbi:MAG: ATP-binding protein [Candidatus Obscuribacterales bacterium]|nr:ATP-binding protein [Candidatus Obscuribacterales bacterium]
MLNNPTFDKLLSMKMNGMAKTLQEQEDLTESLNMTFHERFGLLVDAEYSERQTQQLTRRLRTARLKQSAAVEDIDYHHSRGLDRGLVTQLSTGQWIKEGLNLLISGPTGVGKTYLSCALAHKACMLGYSAQYYRTPRFFQDLTIARLEGNYNRFLRKMQKFDLLVLDDFALIPITEEQSRDLLEVSDDRCSAQSILLSSQIEPENWYKVFENPTLADAILDRIIHGAYKINLTGESIRKKQKKKTRNVEK